MIDWKVNKIRKIVEILEKMGHEKSKNLGIKNIKAFIIKVLSNNKKGEMVQKVEFNTILSNIDKCDHHDLVRVDNIITRTQNEIDKEYKWGSVVQNLKWKQ